MKELNWNGGLKVIVGILFAQRTRIVARLSSRMGLLDSDVIAMTGSLEMGLPPGMAAGEVSQLGFIFVYIYSCCLL
jgi:hypothetical protein